MSTITGRACARKSERPALPRLRENGQIVTLGGYAAVFNDWARVKLQPGAVIDNRDWGDKVVWEVIRRGAFANSLQRGDHVVATFKHGRAVLADTREDTLFLYEDARGLYFELDLPDSSLGRYVLSLVDHGRDGMSFAFSWPTWKSGGVTRCWPEQRVRRALGEHARYIEVVDVTLRDIAFAGREATYHSAACARIEAVNRALARADWRRTTRIPWE